MVIRHYLLWPVLGLSIALVTCTTSYYVTQEADALTRIRPGYQQLQHDAFSPLIIETVGPNPIPILGSDNKYHVAYELLVFNAAPRAATITKIETLANDENGSVISTLSRDEIVDRSLLLANYPASPKLVTQIPAGQTLVLILEDVYATRESVLASVTHRIFASFDAPATDQSEIAKKYPNDAVLIGGKVNIGRGAPVVIGPPLMGDGWSVGNGCCSLNAHRNVILPVGGRITGSERFAIDWTILDLSKENLILGPGVGATFVGDPTKNESYLAFGQPVLAVADGTIVTAVNDKPDETPRVFAKGLLLSELGGNYVVMKLSDDVYAFYAHMKHGSVTVKPGDIVKKGHQIGQVGNSGNTSEAHLHFHLMRSPLPLTADQVPWVFDSFSVTGVLMADGELDRSRARAAINMLPLEDSVLSFPSKR